MSYGNLAPGGYNFQVQSSYGCISYGSFTITGNSAVGASVSVEPETCYGSNNGQAWLGGTGGTGVYSFNFNGQGASYYSGLAVAGYGFTVTDSNGCSASGSFTIQRRPIVSASVTSVNNPSCNGASTGSVGIAASGGTGTGFINTFNSGPWQGTFQYYNLPAGVYGFTVQDSNGCQAGSSVTLNNPAAVNAVVVSHSDQTCAGTTDGYVSLSASGGTGTGYAISFNGGQMGGTWAYSNLPPNTYSFTVQDGAGCQASGSVIISGKTAISIVEISKSDQSCSGINDGAVELSATGGTSVFTISFNNGEFGTQWKYGSLAPGSYNVKVRDSNLCTVETTIEIGYKTEVTATATVTDVTCNGDNIGSVLIGAGGGTNTFSYSVDNSNYVSTPTFASLSAGDHVFSVKDNNNCVKSGSFTVNQPSKIQVLASVQNLTCSYDTNTGQIVVEASGGSAPYTYSLDSVNYQSSQMFNYLNSGDYSYQVKDSLGCVVSGTTVTVGRPTAVGATPGQIVNIVCKGSSSGAFSLAGFGGKGPYEYSVGYGYSSTAQFSGLAAGSRSWSVKDSLGCTAAGTVELNQPEEAIGGSYITTPITCVVEGTITLSGHITLPPYEYSVDEKPFTSNSTFSGLGAGTHSWSVRDSDGCVASGSAIVGTTSGVSASASVTNQLCYGQNIGSITITASGGVGAITYSLGGVAYQESNLFSSLAAGQYTWYAKDTEGCIYSGSSTITQPNDLKMSTSVVENKCFGKSLGSVSLLVTGGTAPYYYTLNEQNSSFVANLAAGEYAWSVDDSHGCSIHGVAVVNQPEEIPQPIVTGYSQVSTSGGVVTVTGESFVGPLSILVDGAIISFVSNIDTKLTFEVGPGIGNNHTLRIVSGGGCKSVDSTWSYGKPLVQKTSVLTINGGPLVIIGSNFGEMSTTPTVTIQTSPCSGCEWKSKTNITCTSCPSGKGTNSLLVSIAGVISESFQLSYLDIPQPPTNITFTAGTRSGIILWNGDSSSKSYVATVTGPNYTFNTSGIATTRRIQLTGLTASTLYTVKIYETNEAGNGDPTTVPVSTSEDVPDPPEAPSVVNINATSVNVSWNIPYSGASPVNKYVVKISHLGQDTEVETIVTYLIVHVTPLEKYSFAVKGINSIGTGLYSTPVIFNVPDSCGNVICDKSLGESCNSCYKDCGVCNINSPFYESLHAFANSSDTIVVAWEAYPNATGSYFFILQISNDINGEYSTIYVGEEHRYVARNLTTATTYYFKLAAAQGSPHNTSSVTVGAYSFSNYSTSGSPSVPALRLSQHGRDFLTVSWTAPYDGGCVLTNYVLEISNNSVSWTPSSIAPSSSLRNKYTNLLVNTTYFFRIQAANLVGNSGVSSVSIYNTDTEICGDLICDAEKGETCSNCYFDCGACSYPKCPGTTSECNGKGKCFEGVCQCTGTWSGPDCSIDGTLPISIGDGGSQEGNTTNPALVIHLDPSNVELPQVSFNISIKTIQEVDGSNNIIQGYDINSLPLTHSKEPFVVGDINVTQVSYTIAIPNQATLTLILWVFSRGATYSFANRTITVPDNSVKYSIKLENWPFNTIRNRLQIVMTTEGGSLNQDACQNTISSQDSSNNLQWFTLNVEGVSLHAQFVEEVILDGKVGKVGFELSSNNEVVYSVPSFWDAIEIDPVYSVLLDTNNKVDNCQANSLKSNDNNVASVAVGAAVGGVVGAAAAVGGSIYGVKYYQKKKLMDSLGSRRSNSMHFDANDQI